MRDIPNSGARYARLELMTAARIETQSDERTGDRMFVASDQEVIGAAERGYTRVYRCDNALLDDRQNLTRKSFLENTLGILSSQSNSGALL